MCKQHLNTFAIAARSFECFGLGQGPRNVTSLLVDVARDSAQRRHWAALRLEYAATTVACSRHLELPALAMTCRARQVRRFFFLCWAGCPASVVYERASYIDAIFLGVPGGVGGALAWRIAAE